MVNDKGRALQTRRDVEESRLNKTGKLNQATWRRGEGRARSQEARRAGTKSGSQETGGAKMAGLHRNQGS